MRLNAANPGASRASIRSVRGSSRCRLSGRYLPFHVQQLVTACESGLLASTRGESRGGSHALSTVVNTFYFFSRGSRVVYVSKEYLEISLDIAVQTYIIRSVQTYSTVQAAKKLGVGRDTLNRWIRDRKFSLPQVQKVGGVSVRLWTDADLESARAYKREHYRKGGGRPKSK